MAIADQVLVLDREGHVVKQGQPDKISISKNFIHPAPAESDSKIITVSADKEDPTAQQPSSDMDTHRQVGDMSVFKFYFSSLGWMSLAIFAGAVVANSVFATLQCKTLFLHLIEFVGL